MNTRNTLYILILLAYALSLVHSVVPHHHHKTTAEAAIHSQMDHHHHHNTAGNHHHHNSDHHSEQESSDDTGHFFFFNHDINADVMVEHGSIDNPVKTKKIQALAAEKEQILSIGVSKYLVYRPPQATLNFLPVTLASIALRGPPSCLSEGLQDLCSAFMLL